MNAAVEVAARSPRSSPATAARGPWVSAILATVALIQWAVVDVLRTTVVMGHYEHRITVVTHGEGDLRVVQRITDAQRRSAVAGTTDPA